MKDNEVISVRDHFFMRHDVAYLTLIIKYLPGRQELDIRPKSRKEEPWRKTFSGADMGLFNLLREWRAKRAKMEGYPPYILFTGEGVGQKKY